MENNAHELHNFFMQAPTPMCLLLGELHIFKLANPPYIEFIEQDPIGHAARDILTAENADELSATLDSVYRNGEKIIKKEVAFVRPLNGQSETLFFNIIYHPYLEANRSERGVLIFMEDVTDQVRARTAIENQQKWVEKILNLLPKPLFLLDPKNGTATFSNMAADKLLGVRYEGEHFANSYGEHVHATDITGHPLAADETPSARTLKGERLRGEEIILSTPTEKFYIRAYSEQIPADFGHDAAALLLLQDITATKLAEHDARTKEKQFRALADSMPQIVWTADAKGQLNYINQRWKEYSASQDPRLWFSFLHPEDLERVTQSWLESVHSLKPFQIECRIKRASDNSFRWHLVRALASTADPQLNALWYGTCTDVTEQKVLEQTMIQAQRQAESANTAKSQFLANMSHEIRTPLGAIMGFVGLLKDTTLSESERNGFISIVERNSAQLMRIIDDILDLSKVEAGMMLIEHIDFSIVELLADFSSLMAHRAREKGVNFSLKSTTALPTIINTDPTRLRQILTNVVGNAIKFTEKGQVDLSVSFDSEFLTFEVKDTGRGISEDQNKNLFQPFSQADTTTTRKYGGTGLGLVLTRRLSEALGGTFVLEQSELGKGSTFVARIRATGVGTATKELDFSMKTPSTSLASGLLSGLRVLLVDDSPDNQALISIYLRRAGATVEIASDGQQGYDLAMKDSFHVILMDIQMPIMDGVSAIKKLRANGYKKQVIALTAHAMKEERTRCLAAGFNDFLSKPVTSTELVGRLARIKNL
jgi:signal transduction histidine kinase/CheY-like chemotaxis protein